MPVTYQLAPKNYERLLEQLLARYYDKSLKPLGVKIALLVAYAPVNEETGDPTGPALKINGYPALASARVVNLRDRAKGVADVEIMLDGDRFPDLPESEKLAVLDHELYHFEPVDLRVGAEAADGSVAVSCELDDLNRPKIKLRKHDRQLGWFDAIAARHGEASVEIKQAQELVEGPAGQLYLPYLAPAAKGAVGELVRQARAARHDHDVTHSVNGELVP